ncbi:MAG: ArsR/SmtB family transcription factor [Myxococcota bacterium]
MSNHRIDDTDLVECFRALANPHRLEVFRRLSRCCAPGTVCSVEEAERFTVGEIGDGLDIAPSTLSHHLRELRRAGLLRMERQGRTVMCWVEPPVLEALAAFFTPESGQELEETA